MSVPALSQIRTIVDTELDRILPPANTDPVTLHEAMRYTVLAGGKRLRPALTILSCRACGGRDEDSMAAACAVELIHTYSLIHDDLPSMDDDDLRRGKPSCHRQFGEAMAILAGDALLTFAFEIVASVPGAAAELARGAGASGMIAGQVADLEAEGTADRLSRDELRTRIEFIHERKTAALITASVRAGAICAAASEEQTNALTTYGQCLGLAFQITDDILDITGSAEELGKASGKDLVRGKLVHPAIFGIEQSTLRARELVSRARDSLGVFGEEADPLREITDFVVNRTS